LRDSVPNCNLLGKPDGALHGRSFQDKNLVRAVLHKDREVLAEFLTKDVVGLP
jgi:hypothetical protein